MISKSGQMGRIDVIIARDADDLDLLQAYAAAMLAAGHVTNSEVPQYCSLIKRTFAEPICLSGTLYW